MTRAVSQAEIGRAVKRRSKLTKMIEDARAAGLKVAQVKIALDGTIVLSEAEETAKSAYDRWKGNA